MWWRLKQATTIHVHTQKLERSRAGAPYRRPPRSSWSNSRAKCSGSRRIPCLRPSPKSPPVDRTNPDSPHRGRSKGRTRSLRAPFGHPRLVSADGKPSNTSEGAALVNRLRNSVGLCPRQAELVDSSTAADASLQHPEGEPEASSSSRTHASSNSEPDFYSFVIITWPCPSWIPSSASGLAPSL